MAKEKMIVNEETGEVLENVGTTVQTEGAAPVTNTSELDSMFEFETEQEEEEIAEVAAPVSDWKFPGIRVKRTPFQHDGKILHSYAARMKLKLSNGAVHELVCELRSADKKNRGSYEKLDVIWNMLPKDQPYMLLGFRWVEYSGNYELCVQIEDNGIPLRVSLSPRDGKSRDDLSSMIACMKQKNLL